MLCLVACGSKLTMPTRLDKSLSECQSKAPSSTSDDEDATVKLEVTSAWSRRNIGHKTVYLELAEAVRCPRLGFRRESLRDCRDASGISVAGQRC